MQDISVYYENGARGFRHILMSELYDIDSKVPRKKKKVHIVETRATGEDQVVGIFTSKKKAEKYISDHTDTKFELYSMQLNVGRTL